MTDEWLLIHRSGGLGHIELNRPEVINALTHDMIRRMDRTLASWAADDAIGAVLITGAGKRGLCAGGDIRAIYLDATEGGSASLDLWRDEYRLNARIASYPKPVVAIMHGLVMGGGIGVSAHARHRVVTDGAMLAMPEVGIGLVPDVGGSWLLARAPGELGTHAALSAARMGPGDAVELGLADQYVPANALAALRAALSGLPAGADAREPVRVAIERVASAPPASTFAAGRSWIDACYRGCSVERILARLDRSAEPEARAAAGEIRRKSPTSVKVALAALRRARRLDSLEAALDQEFRVTSRCFAAPDLTEGIRAQVIDKDHDPKWRPSALDQVTDERVRRYFASLGDRELGLAEYGLA